MGKFGGRSGPVFFCKPGFFVFERNKQPFIMPIEINELFFLEKSFVSEIRLDKFGIAFIGRRHSSE
jgi:hypothetical protein